MADHEPHAPRPEPPAGPVVTLARESIRAVSILALEKILVVGLMVALGWTLWRGPELIAENVAIMTRASQEEAERSRELLRNENANNREANSIRDNRFLEAFRAESDRNRTATDALLKLAMSNMSEMGKDMGKLGLLISQLTDQVSKLEQAIGDLKRKLNPSEVQAAPMPRLKSSSGS